MTAAEIMTEIDRMPKSELEELLRLAGRLKQPVKGGDSNEVDALKPMRLLPGSEEAFSKL